MLISKFNNEGIKEAIDLFENEVNILLPKQYKRFLLKYNGGQTPKSNFKINRVSSDIKGFYGLANANEYYNFDRLKGRESFKELLKDGYLIIGYNTFGDYILIGVREENNGKVYFHYHDRPKKYIELTENFSAFTSKCKSKKIGYIESVEERKAFLIKNGKEKNITIGLIEMWQEEIDDYANIHQEKLILNEEKDLER